VLTHNSRLGTECPDVTVVNCFGDHYPHALCPRWPEVQHYAATLVVEAVRGADISGVLLESWGQQGVAHTGMHDKTAGAWSPAATRLLSICCCTAWQKAWPLDPAPAIAELRDAVRYQRESIVAEEIRATKAAGAAELITTVIDALGPDIPVTVFTDLDPWSAIPVSAVDPRVTTAVVSAWSTDPARATAVATARAALPPDITVGAYVTVLPPVDPRTVPTHVQRLRTAGARQLNLYHLGLAGINRQPALGAIVGRRSDPGQPRHHHRGHGTEPDDHDSGRLRPVPATIFRPPADSHRHADHAAVHPGHRSTP
jgi:hypothetical protein